MKNSRDISIGLATATIGLLIAGCATGPNQVGVTNQRQPGPAVGRAVGAGAGAVVGNVAGGVVGAGEGFGGATKSAFDNTQRVVRYWKEEQTADGRTIMVPVNFLVDQDGRVIRQVK